MKDHDLDRQLLQAHKSGDTHALVELYEHAGKSAETAGDIDRACFYFTHAYVFALQAGCPRAEHLRRSLARHNREN